MKTGSWTAAAAAALAAALSVGAFGAETPESLKSLDSFAQAASFSLSANSVAALPDFAQVSPGVYRSGQPTQQGIAQLAAKGIKTVLKLNNDAPAESSWASAAGIDLVARLMSNQAAPTFAQVDDALAVVNDAAQQPILVHCHLGHDRTGVVIAAYRVTVQNWSISQAVTEAKSLGFSNPKFGDLATWLNGYVAHRTGGVSAMAVADPISAQGVADRKQPDWSFTPGRLCTPQDPDFKEYRYTEHIAYCNRNVTQQMKQEVGAHYGIPQSEWSNYEFDHLIPLCIGGNSHVENLWPQPRGQSNGSDDKDRLENQLYKQMLAGTITQAEAVKQIYAWFGADPQLRGRLAQAAQPVIQ
jgi:tyrosine-protein phosphatase SIW14